MFIPLHGLEFDMVASSLRTRQDSSHGIDSACRHFVVQDWVSDNLGISQVFSSVGRGKQNNTSTNTTGFFFLKGKKE